MVRDTDSLPLDGEIPLTSAERSMLRTMMQDQERARWAWRKLRIWVPMIGSGLWVVWQGIDWFIKHVKLSP